MIVTGMLMDYLIRAVEKRKKANEEIKNKNFVTSPYGKIIHSGHLYPQIHKIKLKLIPIK